MDSYTSAVYNILHKVSVNYLMIKYCAEQELARKPRNRYRGRGGHTPLLVNPISQSPANHIRSENVLSNDSTSSRRGKWSQQTQKNKNYTNREKSMNSHLQQRFGTATATKPTTLTPSSSSSSANNSPATTSLNLKRNNRKRPRADQEDDNTDHLQAAKRRQLSGSDSDLSVKIIGEKPKHHQLSGSDSDLSVKIIGVKRAAPGSVQERPTPKDTWAIGARNQPVVPKWSFGQGKGHQQQTENKGRSQQQQSGGTGHQQQWLENSAYQQVESKGYWSEGKWYQQQTWSSGYGLNVVGQGSSSSVDQQQRPPVAQPSYCLRPMHLEQAVLTSNLDETSRAIWDLYFRNRQTMNEFRPKIDLRDRIHTILLHHYHTCGVHIVGSSLNGFASKYSDTDLCLVLCGRDYVSKGESIGILRQVRRILTQAKVIQSPKLIQAKVPILKFFGRGSDVECDLNVNNLIGIRNTFLLQVYSKLDWRLAPLMITIKKWARSGNINDASQGTLSSYSLSLMLIHYLQGCSPPVLPSLQAVHPQVFSNNSDVRTLFPPNSLNADLPGFLKFHSKNQQTLAALLTGFFHYFAFKFKFADTVICIRTGSTYPRNTLNSPSLNKIDWVNKFIYIEEPFDRSNTARAVYEAENFQYIFQALVSAAKTCQKNKHPLNTLITDPD